MAGSIFIAKGNMWSVSSSAFYWVGEFLAQSLNDKEIEAELREILDNNLGAIDLDDFPMDKRQKILSALKNDVVRDATERLPHDMPGRENWIACFRELQERAHRRPDER